MRLPGEEALVQDLHPAPKFMPVPHTPSMAMSTAMPIGSGSKEDNTTGLDTHQQNVVLAGSSQCVQAARTGVALTHPRQQVLLLDWPQPSLLALTPRGMPSLWPHNFDHRLHGDQNLVLAAKQQTTGLDPPLSRPQSQSLLEPVTTGWPHRNGHMGTGCKKEDKLHSGCPQSIGP